MSRALICGISGQDGAYLARLLLEKGYEVFGTSRDAQAADFHNLVSLGIRRSIHLESLALKDLRSVLQTLKTVKPDEVYNLSDSVTGVGRLNTSRPCGKCCSSLNRMIL